MRQKSGKHGNWYFTEVCATRMGKYTSRFEQTMIKKALGGGSGLFILDVGGGHGQHAVFVKELGHSPILLEYDPVPIEIFQERGTDIPAVRANALELPIRDGAFDVVMTMEVSACCTAKEDNNTRYLREANRVLKKNGLLLITSFNKHSYINYLRRMRRNRPDYEDLYYLEAAGDYARKFEAAGFRVEGCWGFRWLPFRRDSDNALIPVLAFLERMLSLKHITHFSPWLFFSARKI